MNSMTKKLIVFALLGFASTCGTLFAQGDFYRLSKRQKEKRAQELMAIDFDTLDVSDAELKKYHGELKRFYEYYSEKSKKADKGGVNLIVWGPIGSIAAGTTLMLTADIVAGVVVMGAMIVGTVTWGIVRCSKSSKYKDKSNIFLRKANQCADALAEQAPDDWILLVDVPLGD